MSTSPTTSMEWADEFRKGNTPENHPVFSQKHKELLDGPFWQRLPVYSNVSEEQFNDHKWQLKNSITSVNQMVDALRDNAPGDFIEDLKLGFKKAPMAVRVTPYIIALIDWDNPYDDPLRRQFIPLGTRMKPDHPELHLDTLHEQADSPALGLTYRYPDRALFLAGDICPVYCRYCTRSYAVGFDTEGVEKVKLAQSEKRWKEIFEYIEDHPFIEDIVISGGDSYMLRPNRVTLIGETLLNMKNVRRIRYATKGPAIFPQKILTDHEWYDALRDVATYGRKMHKEVCLHTHFSHPNEITAVSQRAMNRFVEDGITVRNQSVLQRGVNDTAETMILLTKRLSYINVQSYYVYQHDLVKGVEDLRTTVQCAIDIEKAVRGTTAGFNSPLFVVDAPGGGGKRDVHSYEHYNRINGISVYSAPSVKPGKYFMYFDPLDLLSEEMREAWQDPQRREQMKAEAIEAAKAGERDVMPKAKSATVG